jgi:hypothetical protein
MRATITLELEITNSRRSSLDTVARARKGAESVVAWAERLRHVTVTAATLESPHRRPVALITPDDAVTSPNRPVRGLWAHAR